MSRSDFFMLLFSEELRIISLEEAFPFGAPAFVPEEPLMVGRLLFIISPSLLLMFFALSDIMRMRPSLVPPNGVERPKALNQLMVSFLFELGKRIFSSSSKASRFFFRVPMLHILFCRPPWRYFFALCYFGGFSFT